MKTVRVGPNSGFKPSPEQKDAWDKVKSGHPMVLSYTTAMENVKNSGGMYAILPEDAPTVSATAVLMPEDMTRDALILTALQMGVDVSKKQMKKADLVKAIRLKMDDVQLLDDDEGEDGAE
jgi:hypothetical protein